MWEASCFSLNPAQIMESVGRWRPAAAVLRPLLDGLGTRPAVVRPILAVAQAKDLCFARINQETPL